MCNWIRRKENIKMIRRLIMVTTTNRTPPTQRPYIMNVQINHKSYWTFTMSEGILSALVNTSLSSSQWTNSNVLVGGRNVLNIQLFWLTLFLFGNGQTDSYPPISNSLDQYYFVGDFCLWAFNSSDMP